jgi:flagellar biosynthesis/type III secretory pathway M-ring protein FliF/YscJ
LIEEPGQQENEDENRDITTQIVIIVAVVVLVLIVVLVVCLIVRRRRIHKEETIRGKKDANRNEEKAKGISYQEPANDIGREEMDLKVFDNEVVRFGEDVNVEP